jgi:hypothetical protein
MTLKDWRAGAALAKAIGVSGSSAQAAPAGTLMADLSTAASATSAVHRAAYRRCWWRHGRRYCRWVGDSYYDDGFYPYYPYYYYYYYGYGPSLGFYYGGRRFHGGGHFRHGGRHHR